MSSAIDPSTNPPSKPTGTGKPHPAKPAAAKPAAPGKAAASTPTAKPAAARPASAAPPAKPAAAKPTPPKPAPAETDAQSDEPESRGSFASGFLKQTPAWAVSMLVHVIALLAMALIVNKPPVEEKPRVIVSSAPEAEENFEEFEEEMPVETPVPTSDPVSDVVVATDVAVVEDVKVVSDASDVDAAPLAVELSDFGDQTAPASDMLSTIGAVGGAGGGFGGRKNATQIAATSGGGADTESAVDRALKWIAAHQLPDGGWSFDLSKCSGCNCSHSKTQNDRCAATSMALLPFLGRGYSHRDGPYKAQMEAGLAFLANMMVVKGKSFGAFAHGGSVYAQGLAGICLSEGYAMSQDNRLAPAAQASLNFIMQSQDPVGGGWGYSPRSPGDTSIVGWQLMALKSGNMAYLQVDPLVVKKAVEYLNSVQDDDGAYYGYRTPGRGPSTSAVGLLCRMYLGWKKDHPALQRGVEFLAKKGPGNDLYFDYYATQIMHHMEGDMWVAWNSKMKGMLLKAQAKEGHETGSFFTGVDGGHGAHIAGRLYCTALSTMILEVYYRHMPIYRNQSISDEFKE